MRVLLSGAATAFLNGFRQVDAAWLFVRPRHPSDQRHGRQDPAKTGDHVVDHLDHAVGLDHRELREGHRQQGPGHHQREQRDRADELANADGQAVSSAIAGSCASL